MKRKIVVVDDEPGIIEELANYFAEKGYETKGFSNATDLFNFLAKERCDLIILDLMLPGMDGFTICENLKRKKRLKSIPVIMLSGKSEVEDRVSGLNLGADDYIVKPFALKELDARVKAVLRREETSGKEKVIKVGSSLKIDLERYEATLGKKKINLTTTEFKILEMLSARKGQVFSRERLLDYLLGDEKIVTDRTIDVHIRHLREKLGSVGKLIKNVRGVGYKLEE